MFQLIATLEDYNKNMKRKALYTYKCVYFDVSSAFISIKLNDS